MKIIIIIKVGEIGLLSILRLIKEVEVKTVRRKWLNLIKNHEYVFLCALLMKLDVISKRIYIDTITIFDQEYRQHVNQKALRKSKVAARDNFSRQLAPKIIKPTKVR